MIKLDILSDPICPWCYIGKANLDRALATAGTTPFQIEWHPYQLNPEMPATGMDRASYLNAKFGGPARAAKSLARIVEAAQAAGAPMHLGAITRVPNTLDAHRLIHWAGLEGRQVAAVDALFHAYFSDARDIGRHDVLLDLAAGIGLDRAVIARLLQGDADAEDIRARDAHARRREVTGVPTFIVAERHVVQGAQPPEMWLDVIADITQVDSGGGYLPC